MSNGKGMVVTALIIGLVGLGLGGYVFYDQTTGDQQLLHRE
jgi:hypothetical protein